MYEDELTTIGIEEEDDNLLPDGWEEGDDIFAESNEADEPSEETNDTEDIGTEDALAMSKETEADGQSAAPETDDTSSGQTEKPVESVKRPLKLKFNHQEIEVDINGMSDEELKDQLEKARAFDAMKDEQAKARYRQVYKDQVDAGMTDAAAKMVADHEVGKSFPLEDKVQEKAAPRDFEAEVRQLQALYPDFKEVPDEVAYAVANGTNLLTAYLAYREKQTSKAAASLKKENEVLKQNAASAAKAPVRGVTGGGATDKPKSDFERGFDSDEW